MQKGQENEKLETQNLGKQKSYGQNYQPTKIKVKFKHAYIIKLIFGFLGIACVVLGVLTICGY